MSMETNTSMSDHVQGFTASLSAKFESLPDLSSQPCIYKAPDYLLQVNEECYLPYVISIGPFYYGRPWLAAMQDCKLRCLQFFLGQDSNSRKFNLEHYRNILRGMEDSIRKCYAERISLKSDEFNEMILVDSAFIICLIMKYHPVLSSSDVLLPMHKRFLEENQIPFFVLNSLYQEAFGTACPNTSFLKLACSFIEDGGIPVVHGRTIAATTIEIINDNPNIAHLVDLLKLFCFPSKQQAAGSISFTNVATTTTEMNDRNIIARDRLKLFCFPSATLEDQAVGPTTSFTNVVFPSSASNLTAAGVKFAPNKSSTNLLDITFSSKGVLEIPKFELWDVSESYFRSMILYEQSHEPIYNASYLVHYIVLLEKLIRTPKDVQILVQSGIIDNWIGSEETVTKLFNGSITKHIPLPVNFYYLDVCTKLNAYANTRWNQWKAILKRDYFSHPWATISVIYALALFLLTLVQTIGTFTSN